MEGTAELEMLDTKKLANVLGFSRQKIWRLKSKGLLPPPLIPGVGPSDRGCAWSVDQIRRWQCGESKRQ